MISVKEALSQVPLFSDLTEDEINILSDLTRIRKYDKNETIIHKLDEGDAFFSLVSGRVKVVLNDDEGKEFIVEIMGEKDFFGELALLDGEPRSASVVAMEPTEAVVIRRQDFLDTLEANPKLSRKIIKELVKRLRRTNEHIESLAFLDVCGRLARVLLDMGKETGSESEGGLEVSITHNRTELANLVGTTRETLTRALKTLETMKYIKVRKNGFLLTNIDGLKNRMT